MNKIRSTCRGPRFAAIAAAGAMMLAGWIAGMQPVMAAEEPIEIGGRLELFVDRFLIDSMDNASLEMHNPEMRDVVLRMEKPWEGAVSGYFTVIKDGADYKMFYRAWTNFERSDDTGDVVTCLAESRDGIHWTKPELGLFEVKGTKQNNAVWANEHAVSLTFSPFLDTREGVDPDSRYKAVGGLWEGLFVFGSPDGIHWRKLHDEPVITEGAFDSQNIAFWSEHEQKYLCYFRIFDDGVRAISRTESDDFINWSKPEKMRYEHEGEPAPAEHLYTNQTHPYFRAPHIYIATPARFVTNTRALPDEVYEEIGTLPNFRNEAMDTVFLTSRGGTVYNRPSMSAFIRPGMGPKNWTSRANYSVHHVVPITGKEMAIYVNRHYGYESANITRYGLRTDGFVSVHAPYQGGEMVTKPFTFQGETLTMNFATSAAGRVRVEILDAEGNAIEGHALADADPAIGDRITHTVTWQGDPDVSDLAGKPIRLRFVMEDADVYAIQFR